LVRGLHLIQHTFAEKYGYPAAINLKYGYGSVNGHGKLSQYISNQMKPSTYMLNFITWCNIRTQTSQPNV